MRAQDGSPLRPEDAPGDRLYDRAPCGLLTTSDGGRIERANATFLTWSGYTEQAVLGADLADLLSPGDRIFYETRFLPVLQLQGAIGEVALGIRLADGSTVPTLVNAALDTESPGTAHHAILPVSARHDYERRLLQARRVAEASEARTRAMQNAAEAFGRSASPDSLAAALADSAMAALGATQVAVLLRDGPGMRLAGGALPVSAHLLPWTTDGAAPDSGSFVAQSVATPGADPLVAAELRDARLEQVAVVPLVHDGEVTGLLAGFFARAREIDEGFIDMQRALARQAAETLTRLALQARLECIALYDPLTGLANRTLLRSRLEHSLRPSSGEDVSMALIFIDLDDFKSINDELGHIAGDVVLKLIARRLTSVVRTGDLVCRFGGDEFVVACPQTDAAAADAIARRIQSAIRQPLAHDDWLRTVRASIGVTVQSWGGSRTLTAEDLLRTADEAMYRSKQVGKDRTTIVTGS